MTSVKGHDALPRLKGLTSSPGLLERLEAAAGRVRLGDEAARPVLKEGLPALRRLLGTKYDAGSDAGQWVGRRLTYYELVRASSDGNMKWDVPKGEHPEYYIVSQLEQFTPTLALLAQPYAYLERVLARYLRDPDPDVRGQVVRCLGRIPEPWATALLRSALADEAVCALNSAGYGYHASVACLAAICLLERGDRSGVSVLHEWVDRHRALIRQEGAEALEHLVPSSESGFDPNNYPVLRDLAPAVALARSGDRQVKDVLQVAVRATMTLGAEHSWESGPCWDAYHLALLGDPAGADALHKVLRAPAGAWHERWREEAAACVLALAREGAKPTVFPLATVNAGPQLYPDCLSR